ncbi:MAG: RNase adapter RapZ [Deltaproteobacteria bacterium]|jgi:UPF0042 nucleotide-binding protein|nr:RNase adapter RapZ [Deltaproteobacteria bacterium]
MNTHSQAASSDFSLIILAGLSGAGKTAALDVFEDMQFFTLDGLPLELVSPMLPLLNSGALSHYRGIVVGVDLRRHYSENDFHKFLGELHGKFTKLRLLFMDADTEVIIRRYAATRRPHPLEAEGLGLEKAVNAERTRLAPLKNRADLLFDTSSSSIHDLRRHIRQYAAQLDEKQKRLRVHLLSFGFKHGQPTEAEMIYDLRFLPNPYFVEELRPLSGLDRSISDYVLKHDPGRSFMERLLDFLGYLLPLFEAEGRYRVTVAFGCTGGRHRSVAVTEAAGHILKTQGFAVSIEHRHLELQTGAG